METRHNSYSWEAFSAWKDDYFQFRHLYGNQLPQNTKIPNKLWLQKALQRCIALWVGFWGCWLCTAEQVPLYKLALEPLQDLAGEAFDQEHLVNEYNGLLALPSSTGASSGALQLALQVPPLQSCRHRISLKLPRLLLALPHECIESI